jgi:Zn-dependent peptidase ImmA (M78 family)/DNA-binding XRE family transcriptional regulator
VSGELRFNPQRLVLARQRRGLTKTALARAVDVEPRSVQAWESDASDTVPTRRNLERIAEVLRFPTGFFLAGDVDFVAPTAVSFRAVSRLAAYRRDIALSTGTLGIMLAGWIGSQFDLPRSELPDVTDLDPRSAAEAVRAAWGLGVQPVPNLIHLCEAAGVRVFALVEECRDVDAFSFWHDDVPFMFIDTTKSAERRRRDVAHELGHLLLHRGHDAPQGREAEHEADTFANNFLLPETAVLATQLYRPTLEQIQQEKLVWRVSAMSLIRRLHDVGLITDWIYKRLCIEAGKRGLRSREDDIPAESSQLLSKVIKTLRDEGMPLTAIARELAVAPQDLDDLFFGLALTAMDGAGEETPDRAKLRLVE